jgi:hypothetical protein
VKKLTVGDVDNILPEGTILYHTQWGDVVTILSYVSESIDGSFSFYHATLLPEKVPTEVNESTILEEIEYAYALEPHELDLVML